MPPKRHSKGRRKGWKGATPSGCEGWIHSQDHWCHRQPVLPQLQTFSNTAHITTNDNNIQQHTVTSIQILYSYIISSYISQFKMWMWKVSLKTWSQGSGSAIRNCGHMRTAANLSLMGSSRPYAGSGILFASVGAASAQNRPKYKMWSSLVSCPFAFFKECAIPGMRYTCSSPHEAAFAGKRGRSWVAWMVWCLSFENHASVSSLGSFNCPNMACLIRVLHPSPSITMTLTKLPTLLSMKTSMMRKISCAAPQTSTRNIKLPQQAKRTHHTQFNAL